MCSILYGSIVPSDPFPTGKYRVTQKVLDLGWVDLDLGTSPGWWAATVAIYCPRRGVEHLKFESTQPRSETFWVTL